MTGFIFVYSEEAVVISDLTCFCLNPDPVPQENVLPFTLLSMFFIACGMQCSSCKALVKVFYTKKIYNIQAKTTNQNLMGNLNSKILDSRVFYLPPLVSFCYCSREGCSL